MIKLNNTQQFIVNKAVEWYRKSSDTLFQFDGPAGTGKSVVLNAIVSKLRLSEDHILPMAYSGQAAIVMRSKGLTNACTLHSGLFDIRLEDEIDPISGKAKLDKVHNTKIKRWTFSPKYINPKYIKLIIIDEAWMVPKRFRKIIEDTKIKTIVAGDSSQLPPIKDEPAYLVNGTIYHLTELMRQSENSPLIYLANKAKNGKPIDCGLYGNDVLVIYDDELNDYLLSNSDIILCGKNNTRDYVNKYIRNNILHHDTDYPQYGERLICRKNNWGIDIDGISLVNGLIGTVTLPPNLEEFDKKTLGIWFKPDISCSQIHLDINYDFLNGDHKTKEMIKSSRWARGDLLEYAYASTVHLAQGSEYYSGTYLEEFVPNYSVQKALNYTAITRFKQKMVYVKHKPKFLV